MWLKSCQEKKTFLLQFIKYNIRSPKGAFKEKSKGSNECLTLPSYKIALALIPQARSTEKMNEESSSHLPLANPFKPFRKILFA